MWPVNSSSVIVFFLYINNEKKQFIVIVLDAPEYYLLVKLEVENKLMLLRNNQINVFVF